jgi:hypothetical protein
VSVQGRIARSDKGTRVRGRLLPPSGTLRWWLHMTVEAFMRVVGRFVPALVPRTESVDALSRRSTTIAFERLEPGEHVDIEPPLVVIDPKPRRFADSVTEALRGYDTKPGGLIHIRDAQFSLPSGLISVGGTIPAETLIQRIWPHSYQYVPSWRMRLSPGRQLPNGCLFTLPHWNNIYHWLVEMLASALTLAERFDLPLFIPEERPRFVSEYLGLMDLETRCLSLDGGVYHADLLHLVAIPASGLDRPSPRQVAKVRQALLARVPHEPNRSRRVYVSRDDAPDRRVLNEDELTAALTTYGIERVQLSELSVADQVKLFAEAELIVGAHGAGLANIVVAPTQACVLELVGNNVVNSMYLVTASLLGMRYGYVRVEDAYRDHVVPVDDVCRAIEMLTEGERR